MQWVKEQYQAIRDAAGIKWELLGLTISGIIAKVDWIVTEVFKYFPTIGKLFTGITFIFPTWILGLTVFFALNCWWLLQYTVKLRRQIRDARIELAELRAYGVSLRNDGTLMTTPEVIEVKDEESSKQWEQLILDWNNNVIACIRKISEADAVWFSILDICPPPRIESLSQDLRHLKAFREHDYRLKRLDDMLRDLWGKIPV